MTAFDELTWHEAMRQGQRTASQVDAGPTTDNSSRRQPEWAPEPLWAMPKCRTPKPDSDPPWTAPKDSQNR